MTISKPPCSSNRSNINNCCFGFFENSRLVLIITAGRYFVQGRRCKLPAVFPRAEAEIWKKGGNWRIFQVCFLLHLQYWVNNEGACVKMGDIGMHGKKKVRKKWSKMRGFLHFLSKHWGILIRNE